MCKYDSYEVKTLWIYESLCKLSAQTQYELESANYSNVEDKQNETVAVTIPVSDRRLLQELVRRFGWACAF